MPRRPNVVRGRLPSFGIRGTCPACFDGIQVDGPFPGFQVFLLLFQVAVEYLLDPGFHEGLPQDGKLQQQRAHFPHPVAFLPQPGVGHLVEDLVLETRTHRQLSHRQDVLRLVDQPDETGVVAGRLPVPLLPVDLLFQFVADVQVRQQLHVVPEPGCVDPGVCRLQRVRHRHLGSPEERRKVDPRVGNVVPHLLDTLVEADPAGAGKPLVDGDHRVADRAAAVGGERFLPGVTEQDPRFPGEVVAAVEIVPPADRACTGSPGRRRPRSGRSSRCCSGRCRTGTPDGRR